MPHDLEAERAVLGSVLVNPDLYGAAAALLRPSDFYRAAHRTIFEAMRTLVGNEVAIDLLTLKGALGDQLDAVGGAAYIANMVDGVPHSTNVAHYAGMVRELAQRRETIKVAMLAADAAFSGEDASAQVVERAIRELSDVIHASGGTLLNARAAVDRYVDALQRGEAGLAYQTGFADLDAVINGLKPGDLVIVAARPSTGKSSLALGIAKHIAATYGPTLYETLEMSPESLAARILSWDSNVSSLKLERQTATAIEYANAQQAALDLDVPLWIEGTATTLNEISAWARMVKVQYGGLFALVVDYIQLMAAEDADSPENEMKAISAGLKRIAKTLNCVVIGVSQLNRSPEARKDKRPHVSDLRGSGALEQDCDLALLLFREEMHSPNADNMGVAEVIIAKNRNGPTGTVRLAFVKELAMFRNLARSSDF